MLSIPSAGRLLRFAPVLLSAVAAGCGGGASSEGSPSSGGPGDSVAPTVLTVNPVNGMTNVATSTLLSVEFKEPMDPASITVGNFTLTGLDGAPLGFAVSYAAFGNVATLAPTAGLQSLTVVTAKVGTGVTDEAGNPLAVPFTWSFTTAAAPDTEGPAVSAIFPQAGEGGVPVNAMVAAAFSEPLDPLGITGNFTLVGPGGTAIDGMTSYVANSGAATFLPTSDLPAHALITATISTGVTDEAGNPMAADFTWTFTTGNTQDTTLPVVVATVPANGDTSAAVNGMVSATFSEAMNPLTIFTTTFTLVGPGSSPVSGSVAYSINSHVAAFTPAQDLAPMTAYTAKLTKAVSDAAGNGQAAAFTWTFTTGVGSDLNEPTVFSVIPEDGATGVCINKSVSVMFSEPMDPQSITTATLLVDLSGGASVSGVVSYDAASNIATFDPSADLAGTPDTDYTVTLVGGSAGVKDAAGNPLEADSVTTFTSTATSCPTPPSLGAIAPFGGMGGSATLTNDGLGTVINGDIAVNAPSTSVTGLHDGGSNAYTTTPDNDGAVNGLVYTLTAPAGSIPGATVTQAQIDAQLAFDSLSPAALPGGIDVSSLAECPTCGGLAGGADQLGGRTLPPGVYHSVTGTYDLGGVGQLPLSLTLDAGGDASAVWVFQTSAGFGTLTVGLTGPATPADPIQVLLVNGAQAANVFWYVPGGATIGTGSTMVGTLLANAAITISTTGGSPPTAVLTTLNGRAISLTAGVTMTNAVINVPSP